MKNTLCKIENRPNSVLLNGKGSVYAIGLVIGLLSCQKTQAQFVNKGDVKISDKTIVSVYMDYDNETSGDFVNDGNLHVFSNWNNDGKVSYTKDKSGKTFFAGSQQQQISGSKIAGFQNIVFDNLAALVPFELKTVIKVGTNTDFQNGIVNAGDYDGKMIFDENAIHSNAGNQSFVDGMVQKNGSKMFEFPIGNQLYFRPSYDASSSSEKNAFTTQYFYKNSDALYPHSQKEETILSINDSEYWKVTQDSGNEKIILSLTLDRETTPSAFFDIKSDTKLAIVRWDETLQKWMSCNGELSDPNQSAVYEELLTAQVTGYGIFTMAIVKKTDEIPIDLIIYNAVSPNGDGINDTFHIAGIDKYPDNSVEIYNRWGVKVFDAKSYNESDNMFKGYSDGRATINRGEKLPTGTYFYILKYNNTQKVVEKSGYLYINNQ
jgi:gliding motility-associated-like protein